MGNNEEKRNLQPSGEERMLLPSDINIKYNTTNNSNNTTNNSNNTTNNSNS